MLELATGTVTLFFTGIEVPTHLFQQGDDRYALLLAECQRLRRRAFRAYQGQEVDMQGDSFCLAFARASDAVSAAVNAQWSLASHPWPEGVVVRVRMGLHTGQPASAAEGYEGLDVQLAARVMSAAHSGQDARAGPF
jgi:class 3 adenylate cyclase